MAIAFVAGTTKGTTTGSGRASNGARSIAFPTSYTPTAGHLALIVLYSDQGSGSVPSGWSEVGGSPWGGSTPKLQAFYRILTGGDSTPSTTISGSTTGRSHCGAMAVYSGVDATPIDAVGTASNGTGTPMTATSIDPPTDNAVVCGLCGRGDNENASGQTFGGSATGVVERLDSGTSAGSDSQVSMYDKTIASGASGNGSATTSVTDPWVSVLVALKPVAITALVRVLDEGTGLTEGSPLQPRVLVRVRSEGAGLTEGAPLQPRALVRVRSDGTGLTEGTPLQPRVLVRVRSEGAGLTEGLALNPMAKTRLVDEATGLTESPQKLIGLSLVVSEGTGLAESVPAVLASVIVLVVAESTGLTDDAPLGPLALTRTINEGAGLSEGPALRPRVQIRLQTEGTGLFEGLGTKLGGGYMSWTGTIDCTFANPSGVATSDCPIDFVVPWVEAYDATDKGTLVVAGKPDSPVAFGRQVGVNYRMVHVRGLTLAGTASERFTGTIDTTAPTFPTFATGEGIDLFTSGAKVGEPLIHYGGPSAPGQAALNETQRENFDGRRVYKRTARHNPKSPATAPSFYVQWNWYFWPALKMVRWELFLIHHDQVYAYDANGFGSGNLPFGEIWLSLPDNWEISTTFGAARGGALHAGGETQNLRQNGRTYYHLHPSDFISNGQGMAWTGYFARNDMQTTRSAYDAVKKFRPAGIADPAEWDTYVPVFGVLPSIHPSLGDGVAAAQARWNNFADRIYGLNKKATVFDDPGIRNSTNTDWVGFLNAKDPSASGLSSTTGDFGVHRWLAALGVANGNPLWQVEAEWWCLAEFSRTMWNRHTGPDQTPRTDSWGLPSKNDGEPVMYWDYVLGNREYVVASNLFMNDERPLAAGGEPEKLQAPVSDTNLSVRKLSNYRPNPPRGGWVAGNWAHCSYNKNIPMYLTSGDWIWYEYLRQRIGNYSCGRQWRTEANSKGSHGELNEQRSLRIEHMVSQAWWCEHDATTRANIFSHMKNRFDGVPNQKDTYYRFWEQVAVNPDFVIQVITERTDETKFTYMQFQYQYIWNIGVYSAYKVMEKHGSPSTKLWDMNLYNWHTWIRWGWFYWEKATRNPSYPGQATPWWFPLKWVVNEIMASAYATNRLDKDPIDWTGWAPPEDKSDYDTLAGTTIPPDTRLQGYRGPDLDSGALPAALWFRTQYSRGFDDFMGGAVQIALLVAEQTLATYASTTTQYKYAADMKPRCEAILKQYYTTWAARTGVDLNEVLTEWWGASTATGSDVYILDVATAHASAPSLSYVVGHNFSALSVATANASAPVLAYTTTAGDFYVLDTATALASAPSLAPNSYVELPAYEPGKLDCATALAHAPAMVAKYSDLVDRPRKPRNLMVNVIRGRIFGRHR